MIQRIQTIWLLLAAICGFAMYKFDLFVGSAPSIVPPIGAMVPYNFKISNSILLLILVMATAALAIYTITQYKKRKLQLKLAVLGGFAAVVCLLLEYFVIGGEVKAKSLINTNYTIFALLPIGMMVFYFLAARNIWRDEKMVKDADRLR
jgi:hypothetical protein